MLIPLSKVLNFDPRAVPAMMPEFRLPAVSAVKLSPAALRQRFLLSAVWQPEVVMEPSLFDQVPVAASVLVPIILREQPTVLLTLRTQHMSSHSGQIAFPGGKQDADDEDLLATAIREAYEEVGLPPQFVQVLGTLPVYVTGTGFAITPVVALIAEGFSVVRNVHEVDEVFEVPLEFLMNPANHRQHELELDGKRREWLSMPYHDGQTERFIWGATAGMLRNLYRFLSA